MKVREILDAIVEHHPETYRHLHAVHDACYLLARALQYGHGHAEAIAQAGLLHDVGKLHIASAILDAPRKLTVQEWTIVREHPTLAVQMLDEDIPDAIKEWIALHHERLSGDGYPYRLRAEHIPREALVLATVDVWDALSSCRPYVSPRSIADRTALLLGETHRLGSDIVHAHLSLFGHDHVYTAWREPALVDEVTA